MSADFHGWGRERKMGTVRATEWAPQEPHLPLRAGDPTCIVSPRGRRQSRDARYPRPVSPSRWSERQSGHRYQHNTSITRLIPSMPHPDAGGNRLFGHRIRKGAQRQKVDRLARSGDGRDFGHCLPAAGNLDGFPTHRLIDECTQMGLRIREGHACDDRFLTIPVVRNSPNYPCAPALSAKALCQPGSVKLRRVMPERLRGKHRPERFFDQFDIRRLKRPSRAG